MKNIMLFPLQGMSTGYVTSDNLGVSTNGRRALTFYNVTRPPVGGRLTMGEDMAEAVGFFSQASVDAGEVTYVQTDMGAENDSFECQVTNQVGGKQKKITVLSFHFCVNYLSTVTEKKLCFFLRHFKRSPCDLCPKIFSLNLQGKALHDMVLWKKSLPLPTVLCFTTTGKL